MRMTMMACAICLALPVLAQAPVEETRPRQDTLQLNQQRAGIAYRELQQMQYESKLAEQELAQADEEYKAAQKRTEESKRRADAAKKAFDVAKAREARARKAYDDAVNAVSAPPRPAAPGK